MLPGRPGTKGRQIDPLGDGAGLGYPESEAETTYMQIQLNKLSDFRKTCCLELEICTETSDPQNGERLAQAAPHRTYFFRSNFKFIFKNLTQPCFSSPEMLQTL